LGKRPALLIIDVQFRTVGTEPRPFWEAIKEFPTPGARSAAPDRLRAASMCSKFSDGAHVRCGSLRRG
jgi:hypothetical protein